MIYKLSSSWGLKKDNILWFHYTYGDIWSPGPHIHTCMRTKLILDFWGPYAKLCRQGDGVGYEWLFYIFMHLPDAFIQSDLQCIQAIHFFSMCVPWQLNPHTFVLLTQYSNTEPQEQVMNETHLSVFHSVSNRARRKRSSNRVSSVASYAFNLLF